MLTPTQTDYEAHNYLCTGKFQNPLAMHNGKRFRDADYHSPETPKNQYI